MHRADGENLREANEILNSLKEHPEAWQRVDQILQDSQSQETKFYACQILEVQYKLYCVGGKSYEQLTRNA